MMTMTASTQAQAKAQGRTSTTTSNRMRMRICSHAGKGKYNHHSSSSSRDMNMNMNRSKGSGRLGRLSSGGQGQVQGQWHRQQPSFETGSGGRLPPPRVLKVTFSGDDDGKGGHRNQYFPLGYASILAAILLITKSMVCWCASDVELAFMCIDLGFLTALGWLCLMAHFNPALHIMHGFLIELGLAVIMEELVFSGMIVNRIRPELDYKMTKDFLVHHLSSVVMGSVALMFYPYAQGTGAIAVGLIGTEVTTFLPVSFRMSVRSKRLSDSKISTALGALFPIAFIWRTCWSAQMFRQLLPVGQRWMATMSPTVLQKTVWRLGEASVLTVVCSNVAWTFRILRGTMKVVEKSLLGKKGKNIDANQFQKELE